MVPIVDANNNRVGEVEKTEAHHKGILHSTVIAEVVNSNGEWLLIRQSADRQDALKWMNPAGGHIRSDESDENALKREVKEELGYENFIFKFKGKFVFDRKVKGRQENHLFLVYEIQIDEDPILNEESVEYKWFTVEELNRLLKDNPGMFGEAFWVVVRELYREWID